MRPGMIMIVASTAFLLAACTSSAGPKQMGGAVIGGAGGAALGSQFGSGTTKTVSTAVGTILGLGLGAEVGASLDRADHCYRHGCR